MSTTEGGKADKKDFEEENKQEAKRPGPQNDRVKEMIKVLNDEPRVSKTLIWKTVKKNWQGSVRFPRSSMFRGVSKNGSKWQVSLLESFHCLLCSGLSLC